MEGTGKHEGCDESVETASCPEIQTGVRTACVHSCRYDMCQNCEARCAQLAACKASRASACMYATTRKRFKGKSKGPKAREQNNTCKAALSYPSAVETGRLFPLHKSTKKPAHTHTHCQLRRKKETLQVRITRSCAHAEAPQPNAVQEDTDDRGSGPTMATTM